MARWWTFIAERFPWGPTCPLVAVFVVGNLAIAGASTRAGWLALCIAPIVVLSYFLRLRLFDEIKDLDVDRVQHPERPLARGLIEVAEARRVIAALAVLELGLTAILGPGALLGHVLAMLYSGAMYVEFFIGRWLRPHLTLYAVTHTASSALLGFSVATMVLGVFPWELPSAVLWFALANWSLFNVFEFARKTFAPEEERAEVETYSQNFGPWGAVALTASQVVVAGLVVFQVGPEAPLLRGWFVGISCVFLLVGLVYALRPLAGIARAYRTASGAYLVAFLGALAVHALRG